MKLEIENDTFYVIFNPQSGTQPLCFWGSSPYGGLCEAQNIQTAWRFDTRKEAEAEIRKAHGTARGRHAKVVRVNLRTTATIYVKQ